MSFYSYQKKAFYIFDLHICGAWPCLLSASHVFFCSTHTDNESCCRQSSGILLRGIMIYQNYACVFCAALVCCRDFSSLSAPKNLSSFHLPYLSYRQLISSMLQAMTFPHMGHILPLYAPSICSALFILDK